LSGQLELANALGQRSREDLHELLQFRHITHTERIRDALDLAEVLLKPDSIVDALQHSSRTTLDFLAGQSEACTDDAWRHGLAIVDSSSSTASARRLSEVTDVLNTMIGDLAPAAPSRADSSDGEQSGAEQCFTSIRLSSHVLRLLIETPAPLRQRGNQLSTPALRRLSETLGQDAAELDARMSALFDAGLLMRSNARGVPTQAGLDWLRSSHAAQLTTLLTQWFARQPAPFRASFHHAAATHSRLTFNLMRQIYPLAPSGWRADFDAWAKTTALIGLLVDDAPTTLGMRIVNGATSDAIAGELPQPIDQVYVQPDLTVIAPGPLASDREDELLRFATLEQAGIASSYRITQHSLERALASGMSETEIREALTRLSLTGIPQPLDYLIRDSASRQGALVVRPSHDDVASLTRAPSVRHSEIICATAQLALQLTVDRSLAALRLEARDEQTLVTALASVHVAELLRASGYPVTLATVPTPGAELLTVPEDSAAQERNELIDRILLHASEQGSETAHERLLELAVRKKQRVRVVLHQANADDRAFVLRPVGLRNGRLRGIDEASQVERTLPVADLITVEPLIGVGE